MSLDDVLPKKKHGGASATESKVLDSEIPEALRLRYKVEIKLGRGSFGVALVLVPRDGTTRKFVGKVMNVSQMTPKEKEHVTNEVHCLSQCDHPNIIQHIETFNTDSQLVLITEFADGSDLGKEILVRGRKGMSFSTDEIGCIMVQLFLALDHTHSRNIMHRDVKPANIFFTKVGLVKLGDFGFSKHFEETLSNPVGSTVCGTPYYLAPELWSAQRYNKKADTWSLGIVLYELMTLKRPFAGDNFKELGDNVRTGMIPPLPEGANRDLTTAVHRMLDIDPKTRAEISEIIQLPVFQRALNFMKETIKGPTFEESRAVLTAHIDSYLTK
eukprot:PhF_6_TR1447/c0_g1_i1/m.2572/K08857/NEK1_4_5; NIMA (never in mitosis gene a)-related kinase 1/4/5